MLDWSAMQESCWRAFPGPAPGTAEPIMTRLYHMELTVADDRTAVELQISADDVEIFTTRLEAPELDDFISALAGWAFATAGRGRAATGGACAHHQRRSSALLSDRQERPEGRGAARLRHPGLGWLGFQLRRSVVEAMVRQLRRWLEGDAR
jgi:hypothetical protein